MSTANKEENIDSPDDNVLDLSVSSPRRTPSVTDRLSDYSPPHLHNTPPHSKGKFVTDMDSPGALSSEQHHDGHKGAASSNHQPQTSKMDPVTLEGLASSRTLDLEKLRHVHHIMQNKPTFLSAKPKADVQGQATHIVADNNRPKMPVQPQNRSNSNNHLCSSSLPILKTPPPRPTKPETCRSNKSSTSNQAPTSPCSQSSSGQGEPAQVLPIRIQQGGFMAWNGQPIQLVANVRLPNTGNGKMPVVASASNTTVLPTGPQLLKIAPDVSTANQRTIAQQSVQNSRIQPKKLLPTQKHRDMPAILPAPANGSTDSTEQPKVHASISEQAKSAFMKPVPKSTSEMDLPLSASSKVTVATTGNKIPSPPSQQHLRFSHPNRPIMPKPSRPTAPVAPPAQPAQPVFYLCTLPTAPIQPQPPTFVSQAAPSHEQATGGASVSLASSSSKPLKLASAGPSPSPLSENEIKEEKHIPAEESSPIDSALLAQKSVSSPVKSVALVEPTESAKNNQKLVSSVDSASKSKRKDGASSETESAKKSTRGLTGNGAKKSPKDSAKKISRKRPKIVTHVIDGLVILESDQPILRGSLDGTGWETEADTSADEDNKTFTSKRQRRTSSAASHGSSVHSPASSAGAASPGSSSRCFKCRAQLATASGHRVFKGNKVCSYRCFSQLRHEYVTSPQKQRRKLTGEAQTGRQTPPVAESRSLPAQVSPPKTAVTNSALPSFLQSPMPTVAVSQAQPRASTPVMPDKPPNQWSVIDVNSFIKSIPGCEEAAQRFLEQEIDGPALLLLKSEVMVQLMGLKIGPVLKICSQLSSLSGSSSSQTIGGSPSRISNLPSSNSQQKMPSGGIR